MAEPITMAVSVDTQKILEGLKNGFTSILAQVRAEVAAAIRLAAAREQDGRVAQRLFEVGGQIEQSIAAAEAKLALQAPTVHRERLPLSASVTKPTPIVAGEPGPEKALFTGQQK